MRKSFVAQAPATFHRLLRFWKRLEIEGKLERVKGIEPSS
tara:strand:- start:1041 stop:1160 length:120 start_codon:yes stop_codon:yes gene_type:complete